MALPNAPQESSNNSIDKGVYLSQGRILSVVDKSTHPAFPAREKTLVNKKDKNGNQRQVPVDLLLEVNYLDESGEERSMLLFGDYEKDFISGNIKNWKSKGNRVSEFIFLVLTTDEINAGVNPDFSMNEKLFKAMEGKLFKEIRYVKGIYQKDGQNKLSTTTWRFFSFDTDVNAIIEEWEKAKRLLKNYKPDAVDVVSPSKEQNNAAFDEAFPYGANVDVDPI